MRTLRAVLGLVGLSLIASGCTPFLYTWGSNSHGQLGDGGGTVRRETPWQVPSSRWTDVSAGLQYTCGIQASDASLWCWGQNSNGQLGDGTTTGRLTPKRVGTGTDWTTVTASAGQHTCGLRGSGQLWCWGRNQNGQVGDGTTLPQDQGQLTPKRIGGTTTDWIGVSTGQGHSCGLRSAGTRWCWGANGSGQHGDGTTTRRLVPTQIGTDTNWTAVSAGYFHTCGLRGAGSLWCWGFNQYGQIGDNTTTPRLIPTRIGSDTDWTTVNAGGGHTTCGVRNPGKLWCWGNNIDGQIGDDTATERHVPTQVGTATDWTAVAPGGNHTCGLRGTGSLYCWGWNFYGQVGDGTRVRRYTPTWIGPDTDWLAVDASTGHTVGLKAS